MIEQIRLKNFQAHASRVIHLKPGLTSITGQSDIGKSAIIRAIRWIALHTPATRLTKHGATSMRAGIQVDGKVITRFKDSKEYGYTLDKQKYVAVGNEQPAVIKEALQLSDINFQFQHDPAFLVSLPPGQIAKEINRIVDLSSIDSCQTYLKSATAKTKTLYEGAEKLKKGLDIELEASAWVDEASESLEGLKRSNEALEILGRRAGDLTAITQEASRLSVIILSVEAYCGPLEEYNFQAGLRQGEIHRISGRYQTVLAIVNGLQGTQDLDKLEAYVVALADVAASAARLAGVQASLDTLGSIIQGLLGCKKDFLETKPFIAGCLGIMESQAKMSRVAGNASNLTSLLAGIKGDNYEVTQTTQELEEISRKLGELCPACGKLKNR